MYIYPSNLMGMAKSRKRKKVYKVVKFKLSKKQLTSLQNYCEARKTTPNKLIKKSIRYYTENFAKEVPPRFYATANQLDMFKEPEDEEEKDLNLF